MSGLPLNIKIQSFNTLPKTQKNFQVFDEDGLGPNCVIENCRWGCVGNDVKGILFRYIIH